MAFPWIALAMGASSLLDAMLSNKKYPPELEALLKSIQMQGNQLVNGPGLTQEEIGALFGKEYENVRGQGKNVRESTTSTLSNMGMSKTGTAVKASQQNSWENENLVTNAIRDMVIAKKNAKMQDMSLATQMAQTATGAEVNRQEKGPDLTSLVGLMAMMGIGTGEGGGAGKLGTQGYTGGILPGAPALGSDPYASISSIFDGSFSLSPRKSPLLNLTSFPW